MQVSIVQRVIQRERVHNKQNRKQISMNTGATWLNDYIQEINNTISHADSLLQNGVCID
jgi:hypothetical protein